MNNRGNDSPSPDYDDDTKTVRLTERQLAWLDDALRWQIEYAEENGHNRNAQKMKRVRETIQQQTEDER